MIIYYFSGTGNSYLVAKIISQQIGEDTQIIPIGYAYRNGALKTDEENIGFIYPSYGYGLPKVVRQFVKKLEAENAKYVFSIVTYGSKPGSVHGGLKKLLKKKKINLNYATGIKTVENFAPIFKMAAGDKVKHLIENSEITAKKIAVEIKDKTENKFKSHYFISAVVSWFFRVFATWLFPILFRVKDCNSCGICKNICPMSNIKLSKKGRPKFGKKHCNVWMACIQSCPKKAIRVFRATKKSRRYFNPKVALSEFIKENKK